MMKWGLPLLLCSTLLAACSASLKPERDGPFAPGVNQRGETVDGQVVGNRLMQAGEYELALEAFTRATAEQAALTPDLMAAIGTANLGLGRLGQSERYLRLAIKADGSIPEVWNNLGVVLMEKGNYSEAAETFQRAYALDNGQNDSIRDNLRKALAKSEKPDYDEGQQEDYKLVRRGSSEYMIRQIP
ncbi:tetratricopeptide repeat protein [Aquicoccus sp. G2-2]|uniref:tetratricopeptide repeat protein n=1 Tax=Aquicoccus sp. G2-2 TaxID=3092120 RepID=UPI00366DF3F5